MTQSKKLKKSRRKSNKCSCGEEKQISYMGDGVSYPVFVCKNCGPDKRNEWEIWWTNYRFLWKDEKNWEDQKHKVSCVMGYFCFKYQEVYGYPFRFDYSSTKPYTSKDFIMCNRLLAMFNGDAKSIKIYIKWIFTTKIRRPEYIISGFGFFVSQKFIAEFSNARARSRVLRRSTPLPTDFIEWCLSNEPDIFDRQELENWNHLNGLVTHVKQWNQDDVEKRVVNEAVNRGMLPSGPDYVRLED